MKKLAIAGASAVLAALPVVGVFAATSTSFVDSLSVTVSSGCTMEKDGGTAGVYDTDRSFTANIATGNTGYLNGDGGSNLAGPQIDVTCNVASGTWTVTYMVNASGSPASSASTNLVGTTDSNKTIPAGTATSGSASAWRIKSNAVGASTNNFTNYTAPQGSGTFISGNGSTSATMTFNPSYEVYVGTAQAPDTYTGTVTYTIGYAAS